MTIKPRLVDDTNEMVKLYDSDGKFKGFIDLCTYIDFLNRDKKPQQEKKLKGINWIKNKIASFTCWSCGIVAVVSLLIIIYFIFRSGL